MLSLGVHDVPGFRNCHIALSRKGVIPSPGCSKCVAHDLTPVQYMGKLPSYVNSSQASQCTWTNTKVFRV